MKDNIAQKKHKKSLARKSIVAKKKIEKAEKKELSKKQVEQALENVDATENVRRLAMLKFLSEHGFTAPKKQKPEHKGKAVFLLKRTYYILDKLNLNEGMMALLQQEAAELVGLYAITAINDKSKGMIFQIFFSEAENDYIFKIHMTGDDLPKNKKS